MKTFKKFSFTYIALKSLFEILDGEKPGFSGWNMVAKNGYFFASMLATNLVPLFGTVLTADNYQNSFKPLS